MTNITNSAATSIAIKNGRVIDPANNIDSNTNVYISNGIITHIGDKAPADFSADQTIDASDKIVCPGIVDMCARLRDPGQTQKGNIASETKAAAAAGITTICCPPDTSPVIDTTSVVELIRSRQESAGMTKIVPLAAITKELGGENLSSMASLKKAGCVGVSDGRKPIANSMVLRRAMQYADTYDLKVFLSPIDPWLSQEGCAHEGKVSARFGIPSLPEATETAAIARDLALVEQSGIKIHFNQLSTKQGAKLIAMGQKDGQKITADVSAHQLFFTENNLCSFDSAYHVRPPFRTIEDRDGLRDALKSGVIGAICSDHQPHEPDAKIGPFPTTEPGISALETLLPLTMKLVDEGLLNLSGAIKKITTGPATILDINAGTLAVGSIADVCVFDPDLEWALTENEMLSMGKNTPLLGQSMKGRATHTIIDGKMVFER